MPKSRLIQCGIALFLIAFYGYLGYQNLIVDKAKAIEANLVHVASASSVSTSMSAQSATETTHTTISYGAQRAAIAVAEYRKNVTEATKNCNCGTNVDKYTGGKRVQWCALFASWVAKESGAPFAYGTTSTGWQIDNSRTLSEYLKRTGTWHSRDDIISKGIEPQVGDIMIFYRGNFEERLGHASIVVDTSGPAGTASLVSGNYNDSVALQVNFQYKQYYGLLGFGRPEKQ